MKTRKHGNAHRSKFANMEMRANEDAQTWKRAQIELREYRDAMKTRKHATHAQTKTIHAQTS